MKDPEIYVLIDELEKRTDLTVADFEGIANGLAFLLPETVGSDEGMAKLIGTTEMAIHFADQAFPNWSVHIHGRANDKNGHWHCSLRENEGLDNDAVIGSGRSPILAQAILAATMRLAMMIK